MALIIFGEEYKMKFILLLPLFYVQIFSPVFREQTMFSHRVRGQVPHTYKTGKIIVLPILIFRFSEANGSEH
jgi:hypothetical protein